MLKRKMEEATAKTGNGSAKSSATIKRVKEYENWTLEVVAPNGNGKEQLKVEERKNEEKATIKEVKSYESGTLEVVTPNRKGKEQMKSESKDKENRMSSVVAERISSLLRNQSDTVKRSLQQTEKMIQVTRATFEYEQGLSPINTIKALSEQFQRLQVLQAEAQKLVRISETMKFQVLNTWSTINKEMLNITSDSEITLKGFIAKVDEMLIEGVGKWENQNNHKVEKVHGPAKVDQESEHQVNKRGQQMLGQQNTEKNDGPFCWVCGQRGHIRRNCPTWVNPKERDGLLCGVRGQRGHIRQNCPTWVDPNERNGPICWFCHHDGHLRRNCSLWRDHQHLNGYKNRKSGGEQQRLQNPGTASPQTGSPNKISEVLPRSISILAPPNQITKGRLYRAVKEIVKGKRIKIHSEDNIWSLISELRYCNAAMEAKKGMAEDLWTANVIRKIIKNRCPSLKNEWSESAFKIEKAGQEVTYEQFLEFLMEQAQMMGSTFGRSAYQDN